MKELTTRRQSNKKGTIFERVDYTPWAVLGLVQFFMVVLTVFVDV